MDNSKFWEEEWRKEYILRQQAEADNIGIGISFCICFWALVIIVAKTYL